MLTTNTNSGISPAACQEFIAAARVAESMCDLHNLCRGICEAAGFDYYIYGATIPVSFVEPATFVVNGFPQEWWERYRDCGYLGIDPIVHETTRRRSTPLIWNEIRPEHGPEPARVEPFMAEAREFGLVSGVSFPLQARHGDSALLSLVSRDSHTESEERIVNVLPAGQLLIGYIHEAAHRIAEAQGATPDVASLSPRERECLLWAAEGNTAEAIAGIIGVSERTVIFHLDNAICKLGVCNRSQAIARVVAQGLVVPRHRS